MEEKILTQKKNGMVVLFLGIVMAIICVALFITGGNLLDNSDGTSVTGIICMVCALALACFTWIPFASLRVLKPQEALVLTLFGKYVGTLKGDGFYAVNPFCMAFNPAGVAAMPSPSKKINASDVNIIKILPDTLMYPKFIPTRKKLMLSAIRT